MKGSSLEGYVEEVKHILSDREEASQSAGQNVFPPPSKLLSQLWIVLKTLFFKNIH